MCVFWLFFIWYVFFFRFRLWMRVMIRSGLFIIVVGDDWEIFEKCKCGLCMICCLEVLVFLLGNCLIWWYVLRFVVCVGGYLSWWKFFYCLGLFFGVLVICFNFIIKGWWLDVFWILMVFVEMVFYCFFGNSMKLICCIGLVFGMVGYLFLVNCYFFWSWWMVWLFCMVFKLFVVMMVWKLFLVS